MDYDHEAFLDERFEADLLQAELERGGRAMGRARRRGICSHGSVVGYVGTVIYPEQEGLKPGQSRCTAGCGRVFDSDEEWLAAMHEVIDNN